MKGKLFVLFMLAAFVLSSATAFSRTTRDLVFEDEEENASVDNAASADVAGKKSIAVKTTVLLQRDGAVTTVAPSHEFKSGDKVKLVFTPSVDGYVYWLAKGSSGQYQLLFPNAKVGEDNKVQRNKEYTVPSKGTFRFDSTPGNEELLCILSTERLTDLDKAVAEQFKNAGKQVAQLEEQHATKRATRDLVFEEEETEDVSTKKQESSGNEPFVAPYILKHN